MAIDFQDLTEISYFTPFVRFFRRCLYLTLCGFNTLLLYVSRFLWFSLFYNMFAVDTEHFVWQLAIVHILYCKGRMYVCIAWYNKYILIFLLILKLYSCSLIAHICALLVLMFCYSFRFVLLRFSIIHFKTLLITDLRLALWNSKPFFFKHHFVISNK